MSEPAVIAVREERARVGNVEVKKEVVLMAVEGGIVAIERHRIEEQQPIRMMPAPRPLPLPHPPPHVIHIHQSPAPKYAWYNPQGKGYCVGFLLVLMWILIGAIALPLCILGFLCQIFGNDD